MKGHVKVFDNASVPILCLCYSAGIRYLLKPVQDLQLTGLENNTSLLINSLKPLLFPFSTLRYLFSMSISPFLRQYWIYRSSAALLCILLHSHNTIHDCNQFFSFSQSVTLCFSGSLPLPVCFLLPALISVRFHSLSLRVFCLTRRSLLSITSHAIIFA